ncbi:MAG TPA: RNA polymerase sigma factor [Nitrospiraceae bacterium]
MKKPARDGAATDGKSVAAFDRLYREHVDRMYRFAQRLCGSPDDAKDLVQETFLSAYRSLKHFRGESSVSTWLYTIAAHACQRMRRKRKGEPDYKLSLDALIPTSDGEMSIQVAGEDLSPEERLEYKELRRSLLAAVHKLPKKYRMVLVLRDMEGLSAREVGAVMGLTERAVKSRLHRARLFVRQELGGPQATGKTAAAVLAGD